MSSGYFNHPSNAALGCQKSYTFHYQRFGVSRVHLRLHIIQRICSHGIPCHYIHIIYNTNDRWQDGQEMRIHMRLGRLTKPLDVEALIISVRLLNLTLYFLNNIHAIFRLHAVHAKKCERRFTFGHTCQIKCQEIRRQQGGILEMETTFAKMLKLNIPYLKG